MYKKFENKILKDINNDLSKQYILFLLNANKKKPINGKTRLMKEMFFISKNIPALSNDLKFQPDNYGPNSDKLDGYLEELIEIKLITKNNKNYSLNNNSNNLIDKLEISNEIDFLLIEDMKKLFNGLTNDETLALTYFTYPEMTIESLVKQEIYSKRISLGFSLYKKEKISLEKATEIAGLSIKDFLELLNEQNIKVELTV